MGKYLENFLGVDTVYSNNERSGRQLARVISRAVLVSWRRLDAAAKLSHCTLQVCTLILGARTRTAGPTACSSSASGWETPPSGS